MACRSPRLFRHRQTHQYWVAACQRFACANCIHRVARRWRAILNWASAHGATPQFFVTLTLREPLPLWRQAPAENQEAMRKQALALAERLTRALSRLVEEVREHYGPMEYLAVVELTTGKRTPGRRPHLHLLVRGPHLPKWWLKARWRFHTKGSFMVDIQRLRSPEHAGEYLIGYTMLRRKQAQRVHLENWPGPRIRLAFWEMYPSAGCLRGMTVDALTEFLREQSHFALGRTKAESILALDPASTPEQSYQPERNAVVRQSIRQLRTLQVQLAEVREHLARLVGETDYRLTDIPGIDVVMAAELNALVGNVTRFANVDKFLAYTGIAPVTLGSGGHENRFKSQFGRRELSALFHRIASTQLVVHKKTGVARNPLAKAYYEKHLGDQANLPHAKRDRKRLKKALLSLMRVQAIRFYKLMKAQKLAAEARRAQEAAGPA